jgi:DnaA family protein
LLDLLDRLDQASLAAQRRITIPFLRTFLRERP